MNRLLLSAAHKSSGKTTLATGLCAALAARGLVVQPFKKGPDYIDPMWLGLAARRPCHNLDFYLMPHPEITGTFVERAASADIAVIEGNKGLYDGLDLDGSNSNAALAKLLDAPVVLVIDARGMTRGIAPLILGYQAFDRHVNIAGIILNQLGGARHESKLRAVIEHYTDVPVIGAVHHDDRLNIVERHLGLMPSNESAEADRKVRRIADIVAQQVDLDRLIAVSRRPGPPASAGAITLSSKNVRPGPPDIRIGIARDAAFGFYYPGDLDAFADAGAELVPFNTLKDPHLPKIDALFIGGGFPEMHLDSLSANVSLRKDIQRAIEGGMPAYAECGGLMYLSRSIRHNDKTAEMVGVVQGDTVMHPKPQGRGYARLIETDRTPWPMTHAESPSREFPVHEFHYSSLENLPADTAFAYVVARGHGIDGRHDGIVQKNLLACYCHMRSLAGNDWPRRFVHFVRSLHRAT